MRDDIYPLSNTFVVTKKTGIARQEGDFSPAEWRMSTRWQHQKVVQVRQHPFNKSATARQQYHVEINNTKRLCVRLQPPKRWQSKRAKQSHRTACPGETSGWSTFSCVCRGGGVVGADWRWQAGGCVILSGVFGHLARRQGIKVLKPPCVLLLRGLALFLLLTGGNAELPMSHGGVPGQPGQLDGGIT